MPLRIVNVNRNNNRPKTVPCDNPSTNKESHISQQSQI